MLSDMVCVRVVPKRSFRLFLVSFFFIIVIIIVIIVIIIVIIIVVIIIESTMAKQFKSV